MFRVRNCIIVLAFFVAAGTAIAGNDIGQRNSNDAVTKHSNQSASAIVSTALESKEPMMKRASSLSLMGLDGTMHSLGDWKGKVVILNFWATWCSPCLSEIPDFVVYQEQYKTRGLQIIGVGMDEEKKLRNVQRTLEINFPVLIADPKKNGSLMETWGNHTGIVPYSVVIDRNGRVVYTHQGQIDRDSFDENILPLLDSI
jgi:peroxiredoxin